MKSFLLLSVAVLLSANTVNAKDISQFIGKWSVNVEQTIEEAKNSPKYKPEEAEKARKTLRIISGAMQLRLDASSIFFVRGKRVQKIDYTIKSASHSSFVAETTVGEKTVELTFNLRNGKYLNMKSSASDDLDFYIWEISVDGQEVDSETKVITDIITKQIIK